MFQSRAMLVELTLRQWTSLKHDKAISADVAAIHHATRDSGKYIKRLVPKEALAPISKKLGQIRAWHYQRTLPWGNNGQRLLPSKGFMEYRNELANHRREVDRLIDKFVAAYPQYRTDAATELGTLFNSGEYPTEATVRNSFGIDFNVFPIPASGDFRVDIAQEEKDTLKQAMEQEFAQRQKVVTAECYTRARDVLDRLIAQMTAKKPRITTALGMDWQNLPKTLRTLNIGDDRRLTSFADTLDTYVTGNMRLVPRHITAMAPSIRQAWATRLQEIAAEIPKDAT